MKPREYAAMEELEGVSWWYAGMRRISLSLLRSVIPSVAAASAGPPVRKSALDTGCGTGFNLLELDRAGFAPAFGIDISPVAVRATRGRGGQATLGSVLTLPYKDASFDLVTSFDVLYHRWVTDDAAALLELRRVLRPGGALLVRVPALRVLWGAHDDAVHSRHRYTRRELTTLLGSAGFSVDRATYANTFLFPVLLVRRVLDRMLRRSGSDVELLPPLMERTFLGLLTIEAFLVRFVDLPVGVSVFALAHRVDDGPAVR
jgi:SAM-dependent methyltransferase